MEDNPKRPERMYTTPAGSVDREAEEKAIQEEEAEAKRAKKAAQAQPPGIDEVPPAGFKPGDLSKADPVRVKSWRDATSPEDAVEDRMREAIGVKESSGQD